MEGDDDGPGDSGEEDGVRRDRPKGSGEGSGWSEVEEGNWEIMESSFMKSNMASP
jgi:hypothetical protein